MKRKLTIVLVVLLAAVSSCSKTNSTPDYSGVYSGTISGICSNGLIQSPYNTATDVTVAKNGSDYVLKNFSNNTDITIVFNSNSNGFTIPSYTYLNTDGTKISNSATGNFNGISLTLTGQQNYADGSRCTYSFLGTKK